MDPDATIPAAAKLAAETVVDPREWFLDEEAEYLLAERARAAVDAIVREAIQKGDSRARSEGIQGLKRFLGTPDHLDRVLEVFCYGWTLEKRKAAGEILERWCAEQQR